MMQGVGGTIFGSTRRLKLWECQDSKEIQLKT